MRILAVALFTFAIAAVPADAGTTPKPCKSGATQLHTPIPVIGARKLGDMPDASAIRTIYNEVDGCPTPVVLRKDIGSNPTARRGRYDQPARPMPLR